MNENNYKCGHCGHKGPAYGTPTSEGVSAPWCRNCGKNDKLTPEELKETELCKHWDTDIKICFAEEMMNETVETRRSCQGLLMNCKNPKYQVENWSWIVSCPACGNYKSQNRHNQCQYCNEPATSWEANATTDSP